MVNVSRTKRTIINATWGFINKIISILSPFIIRTIIIYILGLEYVGLNGLFTSVLQILNLAELGISSAIVFCLYKPIAENDNLLVCAIINYLKKIYFVISVIVLCVGLLIIPFLPLLINGNLPTDINLVYLYLIYLANTVFSYMFCAYKSTLFNASQMVGTINNIYSILMVVEMILQIIILVLFKNYYCFIMLMPVFTILKNILVSYFANKRFPNYKAYGNIDKSLKKEIKTKVKGLFITRLCNLTRNSLDSIFISMFIGLEIVAIYGNYYYIMTAITGILSVITVSMTASVGNSIISETKEKNYDDLRKFNFLFNTIVSFCSICLLFLYQPFMKLWVGPQYLFDDKIILLFTLYFYFLNVGSIRAVYHDATGLWWESRYRAILETVLNLILNLVLTYTLGVTGTILGTLISLIIVNYFYGSTIVFKEYFKISSKQYFLDNLFYFIVTVFIAILLYFILNLIPFVGMLELITKLMLIVLIFFPLYLICFHRTSLYKKCLSTVKNNLKKRE